MKFIFAWYDMWCGAFWDRAKRRLYVFPVPCLGFYVDFPEWKFLKLKVLPWQRVNGPDGKPYLTRIKLFPKMPWGQPYLHIFHAPDPGFAPHDHSYDFVTLPLGAWYEEEIWETSTGTSWHEVVMPWRIHRRRAEHTHRIVDAARWPFCTLFWQGPQRRQWGHWCRNKGCESLRFVYWKNYINGGCG